MDALVKTLYYEIWILLAGLAAAVVYQLLTGHIRTRGMLHDKSAGRDEGRPGQFSPARLQLLVFTLGGALYYLLLVLGGDTPGKFPPLPTELLLALGGSHGLYLGGKLLPLLSRALGTRRG